MTPEEAYRQLIDLHGHATVIAEAMKSEFAYSPFEYLPGKISQEIRDIRQKLIEYAAEKYRKQYTPNMKPNAEFPKLMIEKCENEDEYRESVIEEWFKSQAKDVQQLRSKSLEHLLDVARHLIPYSGEGQEWGLLKDWTKLIDKFSANILILHCYSWSGARYSTGINYSMNSNGEINALESIIEFVTIPGQDPATIKPQPWISTHITSTRSDAAKFYGKHACTHPAVEAFQFFKNDKLLIWFKHSRDAEAAARMLTTGALLPAVQSPPLFPRSRFSDR